MKDKIEAVEIELKLRESKDFLKSILSSALDNESCIENYLVFDNTTFPYLRSDKKNPANKDLLEKLFTSIPDIQEAKYLVLLNMVGDRISMEDELPFYLTIIARHDSEQKYTEFYEKLNFISKFDKSNFRFEHAPEIYTSLPFRHLIERIELDKNNLSFLQDLFKDNQQALNLLNKVEEKITQADKADMGHQILLTYLNRIDNIEVLNKDKAKTNLLKENTGYYINSEYYFSEEITHSQLQKHFEEISCIYLMMNRQDYELLACYFSKTETPGQIKIFQENPFIAAINFAEVNGAGITVVNNLFTDRNYASENVSQTCQDTVNEIAKMRKRFDAIYKEKLNSFFKTALNNSPENTYVTLNFANKPLSFVEGLQCNATVQGAQCRSAFFLQKQKESGLDEKIADLINISLPENISEMGVDRILSGMNFFEMDDNKILRKQEQDEPNVYLGWDYGLKFVALNPILKQLWSDLGKHVGKAETALVISLPNLALFYLLSYLKQLNSNDNLFNKVIHAAYQLMIKYNLCLPKAFHDVFKKSDIVPKDEKERISQIYDEQYQIQIQQRRNICNELKKRFAQPMEAFGIFATDTKIDEDHQKQDTVISLSTTTPIN